MMDFLGPVFWFLVATGILIAWHEYGHFWTARRCGVRVLRFAIGFGTPLWSRTARDGTEYVIGDPAGRLRADARREGRRAGPG